jgi:hypothetical protein
LAHNLLLVFLVLGVMMMVVVVTVVTRLIYAQLLDLETLLQ